MLLFPIICNSLLLIVTNDAGGKYEEGGERGRPGIGCWGARWGQQRCAVCTRASAQPSVLFVAELGRLGAGRMTADEKSGMVEKYTGLFWVTTHVLLTLNSLFFFRELWQN